MEFGSTVTKLREGRGWSQAKLAEKAGVSQETVAAWESGQEFPGQEQLLSLAMALKVKIPRLIEKDEELMVKVIEGTETYETAVMGVVSVVTAACALVLIALSHTDPDALQIAIRVTEAVLIVGLLALVWQRRGPRAQRAKAFRDALEAADGSQTAFVIKRKAGRNTGNVIMQFVLGAIIAVTLIVLLTHPRRKREGFGFLPSPRLTRSRSCRKPRCCGQHVLCYTPPRTHQPRRTAGQHLPSRREGPRSQKLRPFASTMLPKTSRVTRDEKNPDTSPFLVGDVPGFWQNSAQKRGT